MIQAAQNILHGRWPPFQFARLFHKQGDHVISMIAAGPPKAIQPSRNISSATSRTLAGAVARIKHNHVPSPPSDFMSVTDQGANPSRS